MGVPLVEVWPNEIRGYATMFGDAADENQQNRSWLRDAHMAPIPPKAGVHLVRTGREQVTGDPVGQGNVLAVLMAADAPFREALGSYVSTLDDALAGSADRLRRTAAYFAVADEENRDEIEDAAGTITTHRDQRSVGAHYPYSFADHHDSVLYVRTLPDEHLAAISPWVRLPHFGPGLFDKGNTANALGGPLRNPESKFVNSAVKGTPYDPFVKEKQFLKNFGMDVDEVVWKFSGDWAGLLRSAYAYRHVARGLESIGENVETGNLRLRRSWEGATATAAYDHYHALYRDLTDLAPALTNVANAYEGAVSAISQIAETLAVNLDLLLQEAAVTAAVAPELASSDFSTFDKSQVSGALDLIDTLWEGAKGLNRSLYVALGIGAAITGMLNLWATAIVPLPALAVAATNGSLTTASAEAAAVNDGITALKPYLAAG